MRTPQKACYVSSSIIALVVCMTALQLHGCVVAFQAPMPVAQFAGKAPPTTIRLTYNMNDSGRYSAFAKLHDAPCKPPTALFLAKSNVNNDNEDAAKTLSSSSLPTIADGAGFVALPIVWASFYFVATTGAGLPAGPYGLVGALEGLSYLVVVGLAGAPLVAKTKETDIDLSTVEILCWKTLAVGILTVGSLVHKQGCVPNAKPLLDYSAYLPVCDPNQTPGLFGG